MIPGYNHNVQYKGKIYHIQTEDSGVQNPHIITLLYIGGNILARKKTSYEDILKSERLTQVVKEMMQEQHKSMLKDLKNGIFDDRLEGVVGEAPAEAVAAPPVLPPAPAAAPTPPSVLASTPAPAPRPAVPPRPVAPQPARPPAPQPAPPRPVVPQQPPRPAGVPPPSRPVAAQPPRPVAQTPRPPAPQVARPAGAAAPRPVATPPLVQPPPPPPPPTGKIIELRDDVELKDEDIFGSDLISDKSLDEVILSYLEKHIEEE